MSSSSPKSGKQPNLWNSAETHRSAMPLRHGTESTDQSTEKWYFRDDGREFGPSSRNQLEHFLSPPRLCRSMEVMCTKNEGHWFLIAEHEMLEHVLQKVGVASESQDLPLPSRSIPLSTSLFVEWARDRCEVLGSWASRNASVILVGFSFAAVNAVLLFATSDPDARERKILAIYQTTWTAAREFDAAEESSADWRSFADIGRFALTILVCGVGDLLLAETISRCLVVLTEMGFEMVNILSVRKRA